MEDFGAHQQSVERASCPHSVTFEERWVGRLGADKVVASIVGWAYNDVVRRQHFEGTVENRRREVWTITVERDDMPASGGCEMSKDGDKSCRESLAFLRDHLYRFTEQMHKFLLVRLGTHHCDFHAAQRAGQRDGVLQEAAIECRHRGGRKGLHK